MARISHSTRLWFALAIWGAGLALLLALGWWNVASFQRDNENRLISEAARMASQIASLLTLSGGRVDSARAKILVMAAMEDENLYAIKIETRQGVLEGQRRNYLWEPVSWDEEIAENCVQGMTPIRQAGRTEGMVEVWLSPRLNAEEDSMLEKREQWRFLFPALLWTGALILLLWYWGDLRRWRRACAGNQPACPREEPTLGLVRDGEETGEQENGSAPPLVSAREGRNFQRKNPDAWLVTAGMFRQTFAHAPDLMNRLYAEGATAGLCHLGRMLEQAAPCIGATPLAAAACRMQTALNNPESSERAISVEDCIRVLEQTLAALSGNEEQAAGKRGEK